MTADPEMMMKENDAEDETPMNIDENGNNDINKLKDLVEDSATADDNALTSKKEASTPEDNNTDMMNHKEKVDKEAESNMHEISVVSPNLDETKKNKNQRSAADEDKEDGNDQEEGDDETKPKEVKNDDDEEEDHDATENKEEEATATTTKDENDKRKDAPSASSLPPRPIKRARTAYFIFTEEKRPQVQAEHVGEGVAAIAKVMGHMWGAMSDEEKLVYQQKAAEERERVAKELEAWKAAGGQIEVESNGTTRDPNSLIFPIARIRKICKLDPEVKGVSKEAITLITKCAELATARLGMETVQVARIQNRRKLLPEDVANVCSNREQFTFLKDDVKDLLREQQQHHQQQQAASENNGCATGGTMKRKAADVARETAAAGSKPLTSYFGAVKK